jgi:hypothetical protein
MGKLGEEIVRFKPEKKNCSEQAVTAPEKPLQSQEQGHQSEKGPA